MIPSVILSSFLLSILRSTDLDSSKFLENGQLYRRDISLQYFKTQSEEFKLNLLVDLPRAGSHFVLWPRKQFLKSRVGYYANCTASFNPVDVVLVRSGDVQPLPGRNKQTNNQNNVVKLDIPKELKSNVKVAHLNVRSLKSRVHFCLVKDTILQNNFDIFTISETWADLSVSDVNLEIAGYQFFRQDRGSYKKEGGLCIYVKSNLKTTVLEDLSIACGDGFQQLWLRVQCRSHKSFLICNIYRPPDTPTSY